MEHLKAYKYEVRRARKRNCRETGWGGREVRTWLCNSVESSTSGRRRSEEAQTLRCSSVSIVV